MRTPRVSESTTAAGPETRTARSSVSGPPHRTGGRRPALARSLQPQPAGPGPAVAGDEGAGSQSSTSNRGLADVCSRPIPIGRARSRSSSLLLLLRSLLLRALLLSTLLLGHGTITS